MTDEFKQVIVVRTDLKMGKGKTAAQCAHAAVNALEKMENYNSNWVEAWKESGQEKVVVKIENKQRLVELFQRIKKEFPAALIKDAGRTQITPGEITCFGVGPVPEKKVDEFTKDLKLL